MIKKLSIIYILCISLGFSKDYTQADRILDMQRMAQAMQDIQSGFFYNNLDIVKDGAEDLKKGILNIGAIKEDKENKDVYERWMNDSQGMTKRIQRNIANKSDIIIKRFKNGDATQALQLYSRIASECMKCHIKLRKW